MSDVSFREVEADLQERLRLEIKLPAYFREARQQNGLRSPKNCIGITFNQHGARVQRVVHVDAQDRARLREPEHLADAEVELIHPLAERAAGANQIDLNIRRAAGRQATETL